MAAFFLLRQIALERSAPVLCRSFTTSERSTLRSLIPDGTARTARIFREVTAGQRESCYAGVFNVLASKRYMDNSDENYVFVVYFVRLTDAFI